MRLNCTRSSRSKFFLIARDSTGTALTITGDGIRPVSDLQGGDMRRSMKARGTDLSHYARLDVPPLGSRGAVVEGVRNGHLGGTLAFEVRDSDGLLLGREQFLPGEN